MDCWETTFILGRPIFMGYVSFREGTSCKQKLCILCLCAPCTLPETGVAPDSRPSQEEVTSSNHWFAGTMLVSWRVDDITQLIEKIHDQPLLVVHISNDLRFFGCFLHPKGGSSRISKTINNTSLYNYILVIWFHSTRWAPTIDINWRNKLGPRKSTAI